MMHYIVEGDTKFNQIEVQYPIYLININVMNFKS